MQTLPTDQRAIRARQKHKARGDLAGLAGAPHGRLVEALLGGFVHGGRDQRGPDGTGTDGVDADALADDLVGEGAREGDDGAFGGGVVEEVGAADVGVDRGVVDDGVAGVEVREGVFGEVEVGVDVGVEGFDPLVAVGVSREG